jgi:molybdopterin/thiamine biosynthesis adenylyltransferase
MNSVSPPCYANRDIRQREIVPPQKLGNSHAIVIGVGAIGRQVALQLAAMGVGRMDLYDHDTVGVENLACQGYWQQDVGMPKVIATDRLCQQIYPQIQISYHRDRFRRSSLGRIVGLDESKTLAVFCCVDSIATRKLVWEAVCSKATFFVDGRMSGEVMRVFASDRCPQDENYPATLFAPHEAHVGSCTAKSIIYTASMAAGLMLCQFTRFLRGLPIDTDLSVNLLASEMSCADPSKRLQ